MKKILFLSLCIIIFFSAFSQEKEEKRKITNSVSADYMSFQYMNSSSKLNSYEALNTNSAFDCTIDINFPVKEKSEISTGIGLNYRFGDTYLSNIDDVRVSEYFIRVPVSYKYFLFYNENKNMIPFLGLGAYLDVLGSQEYFFKDQTTIPNNFDDKNGFGSYLKPGLIANIGFRFQLQDQIALDFGMKGSWDINKLFINPDDINTYDYSAFGLYFSIIFL